MSETKTLQVMYDEKLVGTLAMASGHKVAFQYSEEWLEDGFSISPFSLPLKNQVRLVWGILIGIYMLWLNKSSTFMAICSTAVMIIILVCSVLLFMMEKILINNDMLFIWSVLPGILIGIWIYKIKQK